MIRRGLFRIGSVLVLGSGLMLTGCARPAVAPATAPTPVWVSYPVAQPITDYAEFTGRTAAVDSVEVRARVWGYLDEVKFKEGAMVKKDDVLFVIDPRTYKAAYKQAEAKVALDDANLRQSEADYQRILDVAKNKNAVSQQELDKALATRDSAKASLDGDKAALENARLNLGFTNVKAPISGRVSRTLITAGNFVQSGDQGGGTLLTTIVTMDPMYAYADVHERTELQVQRLSREGKAVSARTDDVSITLAIANEEGFPHAGTINFVDNQVNPKTGTLRIRGDRKSVV